MSAISLCVVLASCSTVSGSSSSPEPGSGATPAGTSSAGSTEPSPLLESPRGSTPTAQSAEAFCTALLDDQKRAGEAIAAAILHPKDKLTLDDLQAARTKLEADVRLAPADLVSDVVAQVGTMDDLIRRLRSGSIKGLDPQPFNDAQKRLQARCAGG